MISDKRGVKNIILYVQNNNKNLLTNNELTKINENIKHVHNRFLDSALQRVGSAVYSINCHRYFRRI